MRLMLLGLCVVALCGCNALQPRAFPQEMGTAFTQIGTSLADQSVWETIAARLGGEVIEPGVMGYAGLLYVAGGKITGTAGRLTIEGDGTSTGALSPEAREVVSRLTDRPDTLERVLDWLAAEEANVESP